MLKICDPTLTKKHKKYYDAVCATLKSEINSDTAIEVVDFLKENLTTIESKCEQIGSKFTYFKANIAANKLNYNPTINEVPPVGRYKVIIFYHPLWDLHSYYSVRTPITFNTYINNMGIPEKYHPYFNPQYLDLLSIPNVQYGIYAKLLESIKISIGNQINSKVYFYDNSLIVSNVRNSLLSKLRYTLDTPTFGLSTLIVNEYYNKLLGKTIKIGIYEWLGFKQGYIVWDAPEFMHCGLYMHHVMGLPLEKEMFAKKEDGVMLYPEIRTKWSLWK